jgi:hypothetical protein
LVSFCLLTVRPPFCPGWPSTSLDRPLTFLAGCCPLFQDF